MTADAAGGLAVVPAVQQQPQPVDGGGKGAEQQHHLQVEAGEEIFDLCKGEQQGVLAHVLPGDEVHHADGLACQLQLYGAHHISLLDGGADVVRQVEVFLGDGAVSGGGQQGHHAVGGVQLQGIGVGGVFHRDLCQSKVGVQRRLNGKAVKDPVHQLHRLVQGGAAVGVAQSVAAVGAVHDAEDIGGAVFVCPGNVALGAAVLFVAGDVAHAALHGAAVVFAAACLAEGNVLADQDGGGGVLFFGGHGKGGRTGHLHKGVKTHEVPQDQVHIHGAGHVAAVDAAGVGPLAAGGADALGKGVHLAHPAVQIPPGEGVGKTHRRLVGVAGHHGVQCLPVGKSLVGTHIGVVGVVHVVRDGKGHLEGAVQLVGVVGEHQRNGHILGKPAGRHLPGAVLVVDDDIGVGVDDVGACRLHLIHGAGVEHCPGGQQKAAEHQRKRQDQCKNTFHVDNSFKKR